MGCLTIETWLLFITNVFGLSLYFLYFCLYHLECYFMKEIKLETKIRIYSLAELPEEESRLMEAAIKATGQSYAPYSKFHVGAAALLEDGTIITGSNQENAAYPSGLCAERVALFHAGHQYPDMPVVALAIAAATNGRQVESISPCGACRQVLLEAEQRYGKPMKVLLCGTEPKIKFYCEVHSKVKSLDELPAAEKAGERWRLSAYPMSVFRFQHSLYLSGKRSRRIT